MQTYIDPFFFTNVNFRWNDTVFKYLLIIVNIVFVESIISLSTSVNNALETLGEKCPNTEFFLVRISLYSEKWQKKLINDYLIIQQP